MALVLNTCRAEPLNQIVLLANHPKEVSLQVRVVEGNEIQGKLNNLLFVWNQNSFEEKRLSTWNAEIKEVNQITSYYWKFYLILSDVSAVSFSQNFLFPHKGQFSQPKFLFSMRDFRAIFGRGGVLIVRCQWHFQSVYLFCGNFPAQYRLLKHLKHLKILKIPEALKYFKAHLYFDLTNKQNLIDLIKCNRFDQD